MIGHRKQEEHTINQKKQTELCAADTFCTIGALSEQYDMI